MSMSTQALEWIAEKARSAPDSDAIAASLDRTYTELSFDEARDPITALAQLAGAVAILERTDGGEADLERLERLVKSATAYLEGATGLSAAAYQ
jgi:hypothetical protein